MACAGRCVPCERDRPFGIRRLDGHIDCPVAPGYRRGSGALGEAKVARCGIRYTDRLGEMPSDLMGIVAVDNGALDRGILKSLRLGGGRPPEPASPICPVCDFPREALALVFGHFHPGAGAVADGERRCR
jgi:hypothetical protein